MSTPSKKKAAEEERSRKIEIARKAAHKAPRESSRMIVELAQERLKALQIGSIALDARTVQVATFQLAAAAFSAGLTGTNAPSFLAACLGGIACVAFVIGSALAFWGIRSCNTQIAGIDASFWSGVVDTGRFTDRTARSWAAETTECCTLAAREVDEARARWLNYSLFAAAIGAIAMVCSTGASVYQRWQSDIETQSPFPLQAKQRESVYTYGLPTISNK